MEQSHVFLSLGSNLGNKQKNIEQAYKNIEERIGRITSKSAFYQTEPMGFVSENDFINSVCELYTSLALDEILSQTQAIEKEMGRLKKSVNCKYSDRIIDIDILMVDNITMVSKQLTLPHPELHWRKFVVDPFAEIAPELLHPILNTSISELKRRLHKRGA